MADKLIQRGLNGWPLFWLFTLPMSGCMLGAMAAVDMSSPEGSCGYLLLFAMVVTSFPWGRRRVSQAQWKTLHRSGVYFLWAYAFSVYWWNVFSYADPLPIDYLFYAAGFCAFALRIAAWGKRRAPRVLQPGRRLLGGLLTAAGLVAGATGLLWQASVTATLTAPTWSANLALWLPFWPYEPFLPLAAIAMGTYILSGTNQDRSVAPSYPEPAS